MFVQVLDYDPQWEASFFTEQHHIQEILKKELVNVFHIGSTAVKNLKAKPIIDIMPVVNLISSLDKYSKDFEALGYEVMGEFGISGRRYFRKGKDIRTHQIHAFQFDDIYNIERHLAVRNFLQAHKDIADQYGLLKTELAQKFPHDIDAYSDGKNDFVTNLEKEAIKWHYRKQSKTI